MNRDKSLSDNVRPVGVFDDPSWNPVSLKVGQIAYGLRREQVVQSDVLEYVRACRQTFDVVLLLSGTQGFVPGAEYLRLEELLQAIDRVTRAVLFLDIALKGLGASLGDLAGWDKAQVGEFTRRCTSFSEVAAIGKGGLPREAGRGEADAVCVRAGMKQAGASGEESEARRFVCCSQIHGERRDRCALR